MFRKPKPASPPAQSFLLDVAPVKEVKAPAPTPAPVVKPVPAPKPAPAVTPAPAVETKPVDAPKVEKPETPVPAVAPVIPVEKKAAETVNVEEKKTEDTSKVEEKKTEEVAATDQKKEAKKKKKEKSDKPARDALITADRTDYDRKEGVVLFDRNVHVDDSQYQMHADRLFLFLEGTNDLKRLVAIGHVAITNEDKRAYCARATFNKKLGRVVMYSSDEITAELREEGKKGSDVKGEKITFWLDSEQVEVENPVITMPGGLGGQGNIKKLIGK
jgi:lipopolysaccharide transport protein LptA